MLGSVSNRDFRTTLFAEVNRNISGFSTLAEHPHVARYIGHESYSRAHGKHWAVCPTTIFEARLLAKVSEKNRSVSPIAEHPTS